MEKDGALLLALGMTAGFVACGENKGGESVEGSQESGELTYGNTTVGELPALN